MAMVNRDEKRPPLTDEQRRFLETAAEEGYFSVPRKTTLRELAEQHDMSSQEASELLRVAINTAMREEVFVND